MRWYTPMDDEGLVNHWPTTGVDARQTAQPQLVSLAELGAIVDRIRSGMSTWADRVALVDIATEIDRDASGTELATLADVLRRLAEA